MTEAQMIRSIAFMAALTIGLPLVISIAFSVLFDIKFHWSIGLFWVGWTIVWMYWIVKAAMEQKASFDKLKEDQ